MDASSNVIAAVGNWFERGEGGGQVFIADRIWLFCTWNTISPVVTSVADMYTWETMWFW